jgi:hypothetical protein
MVPPADLAPPHSSRRTINDLAVPLSDWRAWVYRYPTLPEAGSATQRHRQERAAQARRRSAAHARAASSCYPWRYPETARQLNMCSTALIEMER